MDDGGVSDSCRSRSRPAIGRARCNCIVLYLEAKSGLIEFEGFGFKFRGASGEIILWVICFLAIMAAIKALW
jgi:hypothetical protein